VSLRTILRGEVVTGLLVGAVPATVFLPFALLVGDGLRLGLAIALVVSCAKLSPCPTCSLRWAGTPRSDRGRWQR